MLTFAFRRTRNSVFSKTKDYVSEFSRYKDPNTIREIRE